MKGIIILIILLGSFFLIGAAGADYIQDGCQQDRDSMSYPTYLFRCTFDKSAEKAIEEFNNRYDPD